MIDLKDTTFIIPIGIESDDRRANVMITLSYLCRHLDTNIIVYECGVEQKMPEILDALDKGNTNIEYVYEKLAPDGIFHRTKFLNSMLAIVKTPVVVNYDADVLLKPEAYEECAKLIRVGAYDLLYPYFWGNSQYQVYYPGRDKIMAGNGLDQLVPSDYNVTRSEYGQCQFFNTKSYIDGGMENEGFISYAPEDQERGYRFKAMGYNVGWGPHYIYHLEHTRGFNSSSTNPMMRHNFELFDKIKAMTPEGLKEYYKNIEYLDKYKKLDNEED